MLQKWFGWTQNTYELIVISCGKMYYIRNNNAYGLYHMEWFLGSEG